MTKIRFKLTRPAKKVGGDRYEADLTDYKDGLKPAKDFTFVLYIPQFISRTMGGEVVASEIEVTFDPK